MNALIYTLAVVYVAMCLEDSRQMPWIATLRNVYLLLVAFFFMVTFLLDRTFTCIL